MAENRIFAGPQLRRLRRASGLTQAAMAERLAISPSYLNLLERNQRPLSARMMVGLAERFGFDPRDLSREEPGGGASALRRRLGDAMFSDLAIDADEVGEWLMAAPNAAEAFARLYDKVQTAGAGPDQSNVTINDPVAVVRSEIERWRNHFADLDSSAEQLADELRLQSGDLYAAISERLRSRHQLSIRILPETTMPGKLRRLDLHARQLQLSEMLDPASRTFQSAFLLGQLEFRSDIQALVNGAEFGNRTAERFYQRHLTGYFAAALMMPYGRFLRACEQTGYDLLVLQRRFGAGFEQVAHRLTTLQRVGARGLSFFMIRVDRAGQVSKRFSGASQAELAQGEHTCPLWALHRSFSDPGKLQVQLVQTQDGSTWVTLSRTVQGAGYGSSGTGPEFAIGLGVSADQAPALSYSRGMNLESSAAVGIGPGCSACRRADCPQRSKPPIGLPLRFDERERGVAPFDFAAD